MQVSDSGYVFDARAGATWQRSCEFTSVTQLRDGTLLVTCRRGSARESPDGHVTVFASSDAGATWEERYDGYNRATWDGCPGEEKTLLIAETPTGDLIGASPFLSAMFHDEPTIESLDMMGLAVAAVGNHEFDEGKNELLRMQNGGCHPIDGCQGPHPFLGAKFRYLAASTFEKSTGKTVLPAYAIREFGGIPVAFIGLTLKGTPNLVSPVGVADLEFRDEADTVNALLPELKARGVELIVLAGFMRILTPGFVAHYAGRLINIHPSLLPAFTGLNTHQRAIDAGCKFAGVTVHQVTAELDVGPILDQAVVPVLPGDTAEALAARVLTQEHLIYPRAIAELLQKQ